MLSAAKTTASFDGLNDEEVAQNRRLFGSNKFDQYEENTTWALIRSIALEPMFILLSVTCLIYILTGSTHDALLLAGGLLIISGIFFFQERRSRSAIKALSKLSAPKVSAIRNGKIASIPGEEVVCNDVIMLEEGDIIAADGQVLSSNDFSVSESILTGESVPVIKTIQGDDRVFYGTMVVSGVATIRVNAVGSKTRFGQVRKLIKELKPPKTPLQLQIASFVKNMVIAGAVAFCIVVLFNFLSSGNFIEALLTGLTLAMSILPEEIPVAVVTFQALGAYRLLKNEVIVKLPQYVEGLGSTTVICVDKTGTLTRNEMSISSLYDAVTDQTIQIGSPGVTNFPLKLIEAAMWASERNPFDPMEKSIHQLYAKTSPADKRPIYEQIHEYPIGGSPPLMTHIHAGEGNNIIIAAKGAPEALVGQSSLTAEKKKLIEAKALAFAEKGLRVLGVGIAHQLPPWPQTQQEFVFEFLGLVAFHDPPIENIAETILDFNRAGIAVKMITGDYAETALAVAKQIKLGNTEEVLTGQDVLALSPDALRNKVKTVNIFARMSPEAKVKVIEALTDNGEVVAMTGDGVNDAPALKIASVGIAMGRRGSEVAKNVAAMIIGDDNLKHMTAAIATGRRIQDNIRKSIRYIVSIHIPIILTVMVPLILRWRFPLLFSPVHVVFLELIMGPTCSIVYENEPIEAGTMSRPARHLSNSFLSFSQLLISVIQGLVIAAGCLGIGYWYMNSGADETHTRTIVFITLLLCNIVLTVVNRSFESTVLKTFRYQNALMVMVLSVCLCVIPILVYIKPVSDLFRLSPLSAIDLFAASCVAVVCTMWIEPLKGIIKKH